MPNLDMFFRPKSIAVIGASNKPLTIPFRIIQNLVDYGFRGPIYPVHPKEPFVKNFPAYKSVTEIPGPVELAHIIVRRELVPATVEQCAEKGVKGVVVNTSGFSETGPEGKALEDRLRELGRRLGVRIFGPNCQGMMNTDADVSLYSNFTFARIKPGQISILAQGGGVAEVLNSYLCESGIGIRMYASNGNACDVSIPEILAYWNDDPGTRVIVLHIEGFVDPREFLEVVSRIDKPILAMKSGTSPEGARAVASHTGRLMAEDTLTDVLFDECNIVRFRTSQELCEAATALAYQPLPRGRRLGIVTNAGSPAILATDEGVAQGLLIRDPSEATQAKLREKLFATSSVHNPVDMMATATPENWATAVEAVIEDGSYDMVLASFITPIFVDCAGVARELVRLHERHPALPFLVCLMTNPLWDETRKILEGGGLPTYYFPEAAARVAAALGRVAELKARPAGTFPELRVDREAATKLLAAAPAGFLPGDRAAALLRSYGIPLAGERWCAKPAELPAAAKELGYPVVLKGHAAGLTHKTEAGAVAVGLADEAALRAAADRMAGALGAEVRWQLQEHVAGGTEVVIGAVAGGALGRFVMFGLGGVLVEAVRDVRFGLAPLTDAKAERLIDGLKHGELLRGFRGKPAVDRGALVELLVRVSRLVAEHPRIAELDLNPVLAFDDGKRTRAVDVRIRLSE